jgi:agmatine/peptidylarginine deiminase
MRPQTIPIFILSLFISFCAQAQMNHRMTTQEELQFPSYLLQSRSNSSAGITVPPATAARASAEWEEIDALMIAWISYPTILTQIAAAAQTEARVYILCTDSNAVKNSLTGAGVSLNNIEYIIAPFNSIWCRDYGQWNIYRQDVDSLALIDWIYNRPRPKDDSVPRSIQAYTGLPMYETTTTPFDLIHTGGNFMCDGFGTGFSSKLILNENPTKSEAEVDTIMNQFMGINRYIKMDVLPYDGIHHIDMHMKLLDEETLLVGEYPTGIADGPQIEANIQYILANYNSVFGTPYKVIRIPMPPDANGNYPNNGGDYRTYTNSVFVNKTIILPTYSLQYDSTAIRIYKEALPGFEVVGINCNSIIPSLGAIHCITKEVSAVDPLLISHQPLHDTYNTTLAYPVSARIQHASGIQNATLYFRTDTMQLWQSTSMNNISGYNWSSTIPAQPGGTVVYYYIEAQSLSGKTQVRPITAPGGFWKFNVLLNTSLAFNSGKKNGMDNIFPNPSHGLTCIPVTTKENIRIKIELINILGEHVLTIYEGMNSGEKKYFLDSTFLSGGVYVVKMDCGNASYTQRVVIK